MPGYKKQGMQSTINPVWKRRVLLPLLALLGGGMISGQVMLDRIVAVVGEYRILQSEVETQYLQNRAQGVPMPPNPKCSILEDFLSQKLLINQARIDSVEVSESEVEMELEGRLQYFISMIGSQEALEEYFGKSILQIRTDMRDAVRESILTGRMQGNITADVTVTPSEVRDYFNSLHRDSIPFIDSKIEIKQITMYPEVDENAIFETKQRLLDLRKRILEGEKFSTLAVLYSEGPSAPKGGEIGFLGKGELDPAYAKTAFSLKEGGISTIVESSFGFHIIQLIERREDRVNTRHILMKPKVDPMAVTNTTRKLDSIADLIRKDTVTFELAARIWSQDKNTAVNGGIMINPLDNTTMFGLDDLQPAEFVALRDRNVGEITDPFKTEDENGKDVYKIMLLLNRTKPHRANLKDDYMVLKQMALENKKNDAFLIWLDEKIEETYIRIDNSFAGCSFRKEGWVKN
jgi:peptidyl-prolyl cis-trans isomerase SurA